jgi:hypothetical protein
MAKKTAPTPPPAPSAKPQPNISFLQTHTLYSILQPNLEHTPSNRIKTHCSYLLYKITKHCTILAVLVGKGFVEKEITLASNNSVMYKKEGVHLPYAGYFITLSAK